jgi:hypothetical protein
MKVVGGDPLSRRSELLTDEQCAKIEGLLPKGEMPRKRGRPWADDRRVIEGILGSVIEGILGSCGRVTLERPA